jgi:hypothetical protein
VDHIFSLILNYFIDIFLCGGPTRLVYWARRGMHTKEELKHCWPNKILVLFLSFFFKNISFLFTIVLDLQFLFYCVLYFVDMFPAGGSSCNIVSESAITGGCRKEISIGLGSVVEQRFLFLVFDH